jgi:hypothetical protein
VGRCEGILGEAPFHGLSLPLRSRGGILTRAPLHSGRLTLRCQSDFEVIGDFAGP